MSSRHVPKNQAKESKLQATQTRLHCLYMVWPFLRMHHLSEQIEATRTLQKFRQKARGLQATSDAKGLMRSRIRLGITVPAYAQHPSRRLHKKAKQRHWRRPSKLPPT